MHLKEENARACIIASQTARQANRYGAFGYGAVKDALAGSLPASVASHLSLVVAASPLMADGLTGC